ncbi:hypothetical protein D9613_007133 [Agrocybe pediades]|uniref:HNH nuclease domain-containing protein n=1 Tax=Agrocybe pediades TaxID=84607 RepID=A0A8H4QHS8_9AGAR|nr:hypothetical protein D9613_007133 [Agrocybe pediades]
MSRNRNASLATITPTLTSCSSDASVQFYEERLKTSIDSIQESRTPLQDLVDAAEKIVNEAFVPDSRSTYRYKNDSFEISVRLDQVMIAMLVCVEECGGDRGKRYVASAIVACSKEEDVIGALEALVKTGRGTPSRSKDVIVRDGYTCVLTGFQDRSHPDIKRDIPVVKLVDARILPRALGKFDCDPDSKSYKSAVTTFGILVKFADLPVKTLEDLHNQLDDPSNRMSLEMNAHDAFDRLYWCLRQTEMANVYDLKIHSKRITILKKPENNQVSFKDHSSEFAMDSTHNHRPVNLPDPRYIAIHAAIAGILHMSGAGIFFDELLHKYRDEEGNSPAVRSWSELEALMGEQLLRESIIRAFQSVNDMDDEDVVGLPRTRKRFDGTPPVL